jgi:hypothetical protein
VEGEGFEPSKAEPTDLQSVPVDRLGTPPENARLSRHRQMLSTPSYAKKPAGAGFF